MESGTPQNRRAAAEPLRAAFPICNVEQVAWLTEAQMIEVDRLMISETQIDLVRMMENAGRNLAELTIQLFGPDSALILAGSGGNGGGGLVAARHLQNRGVEVSVCLSKPAEQFTSVPQQQLDIAQRMGISIVAAPIKADVTVDALIGYSLRGVPQGRTAQLIEQTNKADGVVVSLDNPSGLDVNSGLTPGVAISADATLTLALPKVGLRRAAQAGKLYLTDISVPATLYRSMGIASLPNFHASQILRIDT